MPEICAISTKPLRRRAFRLDGLITPTLKAAGSNPVGRTRINDPTKFKQVDETCEFGRAIFRLESLSMTVFLKISLRNKYTPLIIDIKFTKT